MWVTVYLQLCRPKQTAQRQEPTCALTRQAFELWAQRPQPKMESIFSHHWHIAHHPMFAFESFAKGVRLLSESASKILGPFDTPMDVTNYTLAIHSWKFDMPKLCMLMLNKSCYVACNYR